MRSRGLRLILENHVVAAILALLLVTPLIYGAARHTAVAKSAVFSVFGALLLAAWLLRTNAAGAWPRLLQALRAGPHLLLLLYVGWTAAMVGVHGWSALGIAALLHTAMGVLIYVGVVYHVREPEHVRVLMCGLIVSTTMIVLGGFGLAVLAQDYLAVSGTLEDKQLFGGLMALVLPLVLSLAAGSRSPWLKIFAQAATVVLICGLIGSGSRGAYVSATVGVLVFAMLTLIFTRGVRIPLRRHPEVLLAPLVLAIAVGMLVSLSATGILPMDRIAGLGGLASDETPRNRPELATVAIDMIQSAPIVGHGPGEYALDQVRLNGASRHPDYLAQAGPALEENAHNLLLQTAAESGAPASVLLVAVLVGFLMTGLRSLRRLSHGLRKLTLIGAMAGICAFAVDSVTSPGWVFPELAMFVWLVLGVGMSAAGIAGEAQSSEPRETALLGLPPFLLRGARTAAIGCVAILVAFSALKPLLLHPAAASARRYTAPDVDAIHICLRDGGAKPPACFSKEAGEAPVGLPVRFKVYNIINGDRGEFADIGSDGKRVQLRVFGAGRLEKRDRAEGAGRADVIWVYYPAPADAATPQLLVSAQFHSGEQALEDQFTLTWKR